jgi:hypothetical protein
MSDDHPYRTPATPASLGAGLTRERILADERIGEAERLLEPLAMLFLPPELTGRIQALRDGADDASDAARLELADLLAEAVDLARVREVDLHPLAAAHPAGPPQDDTWGPIGTKEATATALTAAKALVRARDPDADVGRIGPRLIARFAVGGARITWAVDFAGALQSSTSAGVISFTRASHWIGIQAARDLPKLSVRREGMTDGVLKALHLRKDITIGDEAFDEALFVEGNAVFARAILTAPVRSALLERASAGSFELWFDRGAASIEWSTSGFGGLLDDAVLAASIRLLVALQAALDALRLIRRD